MKSKTTNQHFVRVACACVLLVTGCSRRQESLPRPVTPGTGTTFHVGVPSASNRAPSMAAQPPYAAISWTATTTDGRSSLYLATSADNGRTFSEPRLIAGLRRAADGLVPASRVLLSRRSDSANDRSIAEFHVSWRNGGADAYDAVASIDGGRTFAPEQVDAAGWPASMLPHERPESPTAPIVQRAMHDVHLVRHAAAYAECGTLVVAWDDGADVAPASHVMLRRFDSSDREGLVLLQTIRLGDANATASNPAVASLAGGVAVAWETGGTRSQIAVRRVGFQGVCGMPMPDHAAVEHERRASIGELTTRVQRGTRVDTSESFQ